MPVGPSYRVGTIWYFSAISAGEAVPLIGSGRVYGTSAPFHPSKAAMATGERSRGRPSNSVTGCQPFGPGTPEPTCRADAAPAGRAGRGRRGGRWTARSDGARGGQDGLIEQVTRRR